MNRPVLALSIAGVLALAGCSESPQRSSTTAEPAEAPDALGTTIVDVTAIGQNDDRGSVAQRMTSEGPDPLQVWRDSRDASLAWVDIRKVSVNTGGQAHWYLELAAGQPSFAVVEPGLVIAYGLVFDTNGDGTPDYRVSIDNDTPKRGDVRVRLVNLTTGEIVQKVGPPYGYPVEFSHPDGSEPAGGRPPTTVFTFLADKPADLVPKRTRFYAWTSATRDGKVVAEDYAPDRGWLIAGA